MERLFVYGTLRLGHVNAYILERIGGEWLPGYVKGTFYESGWGAAAGFLGSYWMITGRMSAVTCFYPITLKHIGQCWMNLKRATIALRFLSPRQKASR